MLWINESPGPRLDFGEAITSLGGVHIPGNPGEFPLVDLCQKENVIIGMTVSKELRDFTYVTRMWKENETMVRRCPHCDVQMGTLATSCWKCKMPLDNHHSQLKRIDHEEREGAENIGRWVIVPLLIFAILAIILTLTITIGGELYLLILLIYVGIIAFGFLFIKSWKAERIMRLNRMSPWGDPPVPAPRGRLVVIIFEAQKLPEWDVEKSELVKDAILIVFSFVLWILLIVLPRSQGPLFYWWSYFSPAIELFAIYILYPIFLVIIVMVYYNDIKIYRSRQLKV